MESIQALGRKTVKNWLDSRFPIMLVRKSLHLRNILFLKASERFKKMHATFDQIQRK